MVKSTLTVVSLAIISYCISFGVIADSERERVNPAYEILRFSSDLVGMSKSELDRSFHVIVRFQAGELPLPEFDGLSDREVLRKINFNIEPYSSMTDESMMIIWRRYEIETQLLAEKAKVDIKKFAPFYRSFDQTITTGKRILNSQIYANQLNTSGYSTLSSDPEIITVSCDRSCQALANGSVVDTGDFMNLLQDLNSWESINGVQALNTVVRVVDNGSGNSVKVKKNFSTVDWFPIGPVECSEAACI